MVKQLTDWVLVEVVKKAVAHVLLMFVPGAGIVRAIIGIYDTVMFFIRRAAEIARMVGNFLSSIGEIAAGNIAAAAAALENGLARALKLVIDFLARLLKLDGIPGKVRGVIDKLAGKVEAVVDRVVEALVRIAKKAGLAVAKGAKKVATALLAWWKKRRSLGADDERHTLQFDGDAAAAQLMVHSTAAKPVVFVEAFTTTEGTQAERKKVATAQAKVEALQAQLVAAQAAKTPDAARIAALDQQLTAAFNEVGAALDAILAKSAGEGSAEDPLPIDYPKRRAAAYPPMYVGPEVSAEVPQTTLEGLPRTGAKPALLKQLPGLATEPGWKLWDGQVRVFRADGGPNQKLPDNNEVGLEPQFASLAPGVRLHYETKGSTGGGGKINRLFRPFGYRPGNAGRDGDHVMERQIGGPDVVGNLWPLPLSENRSSGSIVKDIEVRFKGKKINVHNAKTKRGKALFLLIRKVLG
jgi:hypothetical protein